MTESEMEAVVDEIDLTDFNNACGSFLTNAEMRALLLATLIPAMRRAGL